MKSVTFFKIACPTLAILLTVLSVLLVGQGKTAAAASNIPAILLMGGFSFYWWGK